MKAYERLLNYVKINTQSSENGASTPSTACQHELAALLEREMQELGIEQVYRDGHAYVYGHIPASCGYEDGPAIGLIAHIDTSPDFSGENVQPRIVKNYRGGDIALGCGRVLGEDKFPQLRHKHGHDLIVTDGSTLLGADDKAGIAEIMTACEIIIRNKRPHTAIYICFCPDEEIGHGAELLDMQRFAADFAYTLDGDAVSELNYETFNASSAHWAIKGVNVHPGSAKDIMLNASLLAMEINDFLPKDEIPARTQGYEGFFHLISMEGSTEAAELRYILRDHDEAKLRAREKLMRDIERDMNCRYGQGTVTLSITPQYRNMAMVLKDKMDIVCRAQRAMEKAGITPDIRPIRGGTDGSQLSFRGLPCLNLGTGGYGFHGPYEHISIQDMDKAVDIILNILEEK